MDETDLRDEAAHCGQARLPSAREIEAALRVEGLRVDPRIFSSFYSAYIALWHMLRRLDRTGPQGSSGDGLPSGDST